MQKQKSDVGSQTSDVRDSNSPLTSHLSPLTSDSAAAPILAKRPDSGRFGSDNIRLSSALCSLGFHLRDNAEPVSVEYPVASTTDAQTIDAGAHPTPIVTFWHQPEPDPAAPIALLRNEKGEPIRIVAIDIKAWWHYPGKYSITGFDDALTAIRGVLEAREWLLGLIYGSRRIENSRFNRDAVVTDSLHTASILKASGFPLLAFEKVRGPSSARPFRFVFPARSVGIVEQIEKYRSPRRDDGRDACADWMLSGLRFHDLLKRRVKEAGCIPMIRMRDGARSLSLSAEMPETLRHEWISHW